MNDKVRGKIFAAEAYAQGKMFDNSTWGCHLPRKITPSDIDLVIDNNGRFLFCEYKCDISRFSDLSIGQHIMYQNLVKNGDGNHFAACVRHVKPEQGVQINTVTHVLTFQLMMKLEDGRLVVSPVYQGSQWIRAVKVILGFTSIGEGEVFQPAAS